MSNTSTVSRPLLDAKTALKIWREELARIDLRAVVIAIYWTGAGGYRYLHLTPSAARELVRGLRVAETGGSDGL